MITMSTRLKKKTELKRYQIHIKIQTAAHSFLEAKKMLNVITDDQFPSEEMGIFWTKHALYSLDKYIYTQLRTWREKKMSTVDSFLAYGVWSRSIINSFNLGVEYMHVRLVQSFFSFFFFFLAFPPTHCLDTMSHSSVLSAETWTKLILWVQPGIIFPNK